MLLSSENGDRFALDVVGYQFPDIDGGVDGNWLNIRIDVTIPQGSWSATEPALLTEDVLGLAGWFEELVTAPALNTTRTVTTADFHDYDALVGSLGVPGGLSFDEPNLAFSLEEADAERIRLRVWFELECRPPWSARPRWAPPKEPQPEVYADLVVTREDLTRAARDLYAQMRMFPVRGEDGGDSRTS